MADSKGTWIDNKTGDVVHSEPEEGRLIHAPGTEPDENTDQLVEQYQADQKALLEHAKNGTGGGDATDDESKTVTTKKAAAKS